MAKSSMHYGATKEEWDLFGFLLGYTTELLPVVSNPNAQISKGSKIAKLGKLPSRYNRDGTVSGYPAWPEVRATSEMIAKWCKMEDYGICMQTRYVRCADCDIKDEAKAAELREFIYARYKFPIRYRKDSSKFLVAFRVKGDIQKTVIRLSDKQGGDIIEFLANGQQFIAAGTHQDGARYEWDWNGCDDFPEITMEEYIKFRDDMAAQFGVRVDTSKSGLRKPKGAVGKADDVIKYLRARGFVLSDAMDGGVNIDCPWKEGHSSDNGES